MPFRPLILMIASPSTSSAMIYFGANLVSWWFKKQPVVARSSTKVEYCCLAHTIAELTNIQTLLIELPVSSSF